MRQSCLRRRGSRGFSLIELLIVIAIILIILAIAVPKLGSAKMNANEMAVLRELQTITSIEIQYMSQFGRYATTLAELGPPPAEAPVRKPRTSFQAAWQAATKMATSSPWRRRVTR